MMRFKLSALLASALFVAIANVGGFPFTDEAECDDCEQDSSIELTNSTVRVLPKQTVETSAFSVGARQADWFLSFPGGALPEVSASLLGKTQETTFVDISVNATNLIPPQEGKTKGPWFWDVIAAFPEAEGDGDSKPLKVVPLFPKISIPVAFRPLGFGSVRVTAKLQNEGSEQCTWEEPFVYPLMGFPLAEAENIVSNGSEQTFLVDLVPASRDLIAAVQAQGITMSVSIDISAKCGPFSTSRVVRLNVAPILL